MAGSLVHAPAIIRAVRAKKILGKNIQWSEDQWELNKVESEVGKRVI